MVTLDALAQRYNLLPSQALEQATTLDLRVMEIGNRYANRKNQLNQSGGSARARPQLTQQEMKRMILESKNNPRKMKRKDKERAV